jgi:hypothetical protein
LPPAWPPVTLAPRFGRVGVARESERQRWGRSDTDGLVAEVVDMVPGCGVWAAPWWGDRYCSESVGCVQL